MRILPEILLAMAGLSLGFFIASGLVALVIGLGIVTRYAGITKTAGSLRFYECCCMAGALFGDLFSLGTFSFSLPSWTAGVLAFCGHLSGKLDHRARRSRQPVFDPLPPDRTDARTAVCNSLHGGRENRRLSLLFCKWISIRTGGKM